MRLLEGLGKCEHCGEVVSVEGMPGGSIDAKWVCPTCGKELTHKTFGYEEVEGEWKKVRWVGANNKWTIRRPTRDFYLNGLLIVVDLPRVTPY